MPDYININIRISDRRVLYDFHVKALSIMKLDFGVSA